MSIIKRVAHALLVDFPLSRKRVLYSVGQGTHLGLRFKVSHSVSPDNREYLTIGNNCLLNCKVIFESTGGRVDIGNNTNIGNSTIICRNKVSIGNHVTMAWGITVYDHDSHSLDYKIRRIDHDTILADTIKGIPLQNKNWDTVKSAPIVINDDAWIGMNAIILKGVTIGRGAIIGAGSVVTKDVPDFCVAAGNPAVVVKTIEEVV